jgi:hypothetical protein
MKTIDTLEQDIYKMLQQGGETAPELEEYFADSCKNIIKRALAKKESSRRLRMSNIGKKNRQLWYEMKGYEGEKFEGNTLVKFLFGDIVEALILTLAKAAGHEVTDEQALVEVDGIKGSTDCCIDGQLVDVKSCSSYAFNNKFQAEAKLGDDEFGYYGQAAGYSAGMNKPFLGWLAIDKQNGSIRLSKANADRIPDAHALIAEKKAAVALDTPPERCYDDEPYQKSGNMALATGCSYCSYKHECWKDANEGSGLRTFIYSGKPVFLTKVVREPTAQEVV